MATKPFKLQLVETFTTLMTAAFGMIAALAWNEAIKKLIESVFPSGDDQLIPLLVYAVFITLIAVICIVVITRTLGKLRTSIEEQEAGKQQK